MARKYQYTSLDRIFSKIYRDLGLEEISETDLIEWSGEALNFMEMPSLLEEAVAFIEICNHHADLPNNLQSIIQVARDNHYCPKTEETKTCASTVIENYSCGCGTTETTNTTTCNTQPKGFENYPVPLDCNGSPITDYELAYYRPYFDLQYEYYGWSNSKLYKERYTPVRLANHTFFSSLVCPENDPVYQQHCDSVDEYTIVENRIRTSFKDGYIAVAYYKQKVDLETGYPLIPDDVSFITAITMYITMKYMARLWYMGREGYTEKYKKAEADWHWYCKQAMNQAHGFYGIDDYQNLLEERNHLIPRHNRYYGFFGKLGRLENKSFKDPNRRNFRLRDI